MKLSEQEKSWFDKLTSQKKDSYNALKKEGILKKFIQIIVDTYSDKAHFIYELIQNADDAEASLIRIKLRKDALIFKHNGTVPFTITDPDNDDIGIRKGHVNSIVLFDSEKEDEVNKIGKFGIGFKSVFKYCDEPEIYNTKIDFKIKNYICPELIKIPQFCLTEGFTTIFYLPFKVQKGENTDYYMDSRECLENLQNSMLFLNNVKEIQLNYDGKEWIYKNNLLEENLIHNNTLFQKIKIGALQYHKYSRNSQVVENQKVSICIPSKDKELFPENVDTKSYKYAYCFFPTKNETRLNFLVHAPFVVTPNREGIKDINENQQLIHELAELFKIVLSDITEKKMLNTENFWKLPFNEKDFTDNNFKSLYTNFLNCINNGSYFSTNDGRYLDKENSYLAESEEMINTISTELLIRLTNNQNAGWVLHKTNKNHGDKFLFAKKYVKEYFDAESLAKLLSSTILQGLDLDTHKQLYHFFNKKEPKNILKSNDIVLLSSGKYDYPANVYFPVSNLSEDNENNFIESKLIEDNSLRQFFKDLGVKEFDDKEKVILLLKRFYQNQVELDFDLKLHLEHISLFVEYWRKYSDIDTFKKYSFLLGDSGLLLNHDSIYIDSPYKVTNLSNYFTHFFSNKIDIDIRKKILSTNIDIIKDSLSLSYKNLDNNEHFVNFVINLGCCLELEVTETQIPNEHPKYLTLKGNYCTYNNRRSIIIDKDYRINLLEVLLDNIDIANSKMIWNRMCKLEPYQLNAIYQVGKKGKINEDKSSLVYTLMENNWIPTKSGEFKKPNETTKEDLLEGFYFNDTNGWLTAIEFGTSKKEYQILKELATLKGISEMDLTKLFAIPEEKLKEIIQENTPSIIDTITPEVLVKANSEISRIISEDVKKKPQKSYAVKSRNIRIIQIPKDDIKNYLKSHYSNEFHTSCQICERELSVKYESNYYFEKVQVFDSNEIVDKDIVENHLILCPLCSIRYQLYKKDSKLMSELANKLIQSNLNNTKVSLPVSNKIEPPIKSITFKQDHLLGLKAAIKIINSI